MGAPRYVDPPLPLRTREAKGTATPHHLGRFELIERIGQGGMAEVFRAAVTGPEGFRRELVVKRVLPQLSARERFTQMFVNEAKISALLAHPNIVQIFEFGEAGGAYFIAMESVRGLTLREVLTKLREQGTAMPVVTAAEITREVLTALDYAHCLRDAEGRPLEIIHRDVSPSNIMLAETGAVKVLDFGIARAADLISDDDGDVVKGKIAYVAPEQIACRDVDRRVDLFAVGCVLHEMLTGRVLFRAQNNLQRKLELLAERSLPPSAWNPDVPPAVDEIVRRAVERDPDARYSSAADMLVDVENYLASFRSSHRAVLRLVRSLSEEPEATDTPEVAPPVVAGLPQTAVTSPERPGGRVKGRVTGAPGINDRSFSGTGSGTGTHSGSSLAPIPGSTSGPMAARLGNAAHAERDRFTRARHGRQALLVACWLGAFVLVAAAGLGVRGFIKGHLNGPAKEAVADRAAGVVQTTPGTVVPLGVTAERRPTPEKPKRRPARGSAGKRVPHRP
ncbi:MAG TPA: serine/threonine-protein kinase [Polyangia bacterium]